MDTRRPSLAPEQFGPLQGVGILSTGTIVVQPFAASLAADMGAEVIRACVQHSGREQPAESTCWGMAGSGRFAHRDLTRRVSLPT